MIKPSNEEFKLKQDIINAINNNKGDIPDRIYNDIIISALYNLTLQYIKTTKTSRPAKW